MPRPIYPHAATDNRKGPMSDHRHPVDPNRVAAASAASLDAEQAARLRELIEVVGEPVRARVLTALQAASPLCVGDIALALGVSEDAVSYALRNLRAHGLVAREAQGRFAFYRLAATAQDHPLLEALDCLRRALGPGRPPP